RNSLIDALHSTDPAADRADKMKVYDWLIGHWTMDAIVYRDDGTKHEGPGEIHFGWVLEGRAIQDVWILPGVFYGTTLRVYDPGIVTWPILWSAPLPTVLHAPGRTLAWRRHRAAGNERCGRSSTLELSQYHRRIVPLDRRTLTR